MEGLEKFRSAKFIFLIGIGGSNLASKAVWNAMTLHRASAASAGKKIFFLESPDEREYEEIKNFAEKEAVNMEDIVLIAVSKSGKTAETLEAFHKTFDILSEKFGVSIDDRVIVISSPDTPLWKLANEKNFEKLEWQEGIGGRFSAFTVAHTTPIMIAGLDAQSFVAGGKEVEEKCKDQGNGPAGKLAQKIFENYKSGADILDFFFFNSELEDLGKWCRQLVAESLGKENKKGEKVGVIPTVSIGPTDLHSMLQLDLGGPKNRFTIFVKSTKEIDETINEKIYTDITAAYEKAGLPFEKYEMPEISEREIGKLMSLMMQMVVALANLLKVNPFDQPEVEEYKKNLEREEKTI